MTFYMFVKLFVVQISIVFQTFGFWSCVEVLELNFIGRFFFEVQQFGQIMLNLLFLFFVQWLLLFVQIVDDEKVFSIWFVEVNSIDFIIIWLTWADYITKVVTVIKDVVRWVHEHFHLISNFKFYGYQVNILLLEKNHNNIGELTASVDAFL